MTAPAWSRRRLIPSQDTDEGCRRLEHQDLHELTVLELKAERVLIGHELAWRVFGRTRDRYIVSLPTPVTENGWLSERRQRLDAELELRQRRGGRVP